MIAFKRQRRAVAFGVVTLFAIAMTQAPAFAQGTDAKAAKAKPAAPIGTITCGTKKIAVMGVAAAWGPGDDKQALNIVFHGIPITANDAAIAAAREAPSGKSGMADPTKLGFKDDGKRSNELYDNRVMWIRFELRDKAKPASLDLKSLAGDKMFSTLNLICGKGEEDVNLGRGPYNKDKVPADFTAFSADLKHGGKLAFVTKGKVTPDPKNKYGPKKPASWDIKVDTIVHQFP